MSIGIREILRDTMRRWPKTWALLASVDTRRMAETGTGSVRSTGSAVAESETPDA